MRAARIHEYGAPDVLRVEDVPDPTAGPRDVLIETHAAAVNPIDWKLRSGAQRAFIRYELPVALGMDASGVVVAKGARVSRFDVGDEVYTSPSHKRPGAYAEYIAVDEREVARKPKNLDHQQAACLPLVALTAWDALVDKAAVVAGQRVLIHAGAGGVGTVAIQLAKHLGASVATTCSARNVELVRGLGADVAIDYTKDRFDEQLEGYDMVLDALGGETMRRSVGVLRRGGHLATMVTGIPEHVKRHGPVLGALVALAKLTGFRISTRVRRGVRTSIVLRRPDGERLGRITQLVEAGAIKPVIDRVLPLDGIVEAHRHGETGHARGKIVIALR